MSLPSLLRRVGHAVPRGVSVDGRIVTGAAAAAAIAAGTANRVAPHAFHGGKDPTTPDQESGAWWENAEARARDTAAMAAAFPTFRLDDGDGGYDWRGVIDTGRGRFRVAIIGSPRGRLPQVVPLQPRSFSRHEGRTLRRSPHLYDSGNLCVAAQDDWDAEHHTTATVVGWTAHWLAAYTDWRLGGPWPTAGYQPYAAA